MKLAESSLDHPIMRSTTSLSSVRFRDAIVLGIGAAAFAIGIACTRAAEISAVDTGSPLQVILIEGEIVAGDYLRFMEIARDVRRGGIVLSSPGGNLKEGLDIGRVIRERGYSTGVLAETVCASSCGLMWLAGTQRFMAPSAQVGFHAAYVSTTDGTRETGIGNALVGAYLTELGLPIEAVIFSTMVGPDQMSWLTVEEARRVGIEVELLDGVSPQTVSPREIEVSDTLGEPHVSSMPLVLPDGYRWIVVQSSLDLNALPVIKARETFGDESVAVVKSSNGYYAVVFGPLQEQDAKARMKTLKEIGTLPADAYLSSGSRFVSRIE